MAQQWNWEKCTYIYLKVLLKTSLTHDSAPLSTSHDFIGPSKSKLTSDTQVDQNNNISEVHRGP